MPLDVRNDVCRNLQRLYRLLIALEHLDCGPAAGCLLNLAVQRLLDVRYRMLDGSCENVRALAPCAVLRRLHRQLGGGFVVLAFESGNLDYRAAELLGKLDGVEPVAVLIKDIAHVHGHHHGQTQLQQLRRQVEVAFEVRAVDDVQDGVWLLVDEIVPGHDLFQRIWREGVDARQVLNDDVLVSREDAVFLFDCDARPVADVLGRAGERVEKGGLAAVGVSCESDLDISHV